MTDDTVSLREYLEKVMELEFAAVRAAVDKAFESKTEADVIVANKIEGLRARIEENLTKTEYEIRHRELVKKMEDLWDFRTNVGGRETTLKWVWAIAATIAGLMLGHFWK